MQITKQLIKSLVPLPRENDTHKGDYGHLLIVAGSLNMAGAAVLIVTAALRSGAGLVTLAIPQKIYNAVLSRLPAESMTLVLPDTDQGSISEKSYSIILQYIQKRKITGLAIGPGISLNSETTGLVQELLMSPEIRNLPVVLDADGLAGFVIRNNMIITPHPGEFSRMTDTPIVKIQELREQSAKQFAKDNGTIVVLKGCKTIVTDGDKVYVNPTGNPGMATGGSGDVLTGMIAGLMIQVITEPDKNKLLNAALAGVYLHGLAGDMAANELTQISMLPTDMIKQIPASIKSIIK
jgi:NAD(P)H-hydrate epimerase